jgi:hypothetical protein
MTMTLTIAPIVEGHGDARAVPILLRRIFAELFHGSFVEVLPPIRVPKSKLIKPAEMMRAVSLADLKLREKRAPQRLILVIFDADQDPACELAPRLLTNVYAERQDLDVAVVLAVPEFETWFIAAAESLTTYLDLEGSEIPDDVDEAGLKKAWLQQHFRSRYTETIEQPALTARMDLDRCRARSHSFDKLCRELAKRT